MYTLHIWLPLARWSTDWERFGGTCQWEENEVQLAPDALCKPLEVLGLKLQGLDVGIKASIDVVSRGVGLR